MPALTHPTLALASPSSPSTFTTNTAPLVGLAAYDIRAATATAAMTQQSSPTSSRRPSGSPKSGLPAGFTPLPELAMTPSAMPSRRPPMQSPVTPYSPLPIAGSSSASGRTTPATRSRKHQQSTSTYIPTRSVMGYGASAAASERGVSSAVSQHRSAYPGSSKFFIVAVPPVDLPSESPHSRGSALAGAQNQMRRGSLIPLYPTLGGQLYAIAREYGLPSIGGLTLFLCDDGEGNLGPRVGDAAWASIWSRYFDEGAEEQYADVSGGGSGSRSAGHTRDFSAASSRSPRTTARSREEGDEYLSTTDSEEQAGRRSSSRSQAGGSIPNGFARASPLPYGASPGSRSDRYAGPPSGRSSAFALARLPIVGRIEWMVERHRAPWWSSWIGEAAPEESSSPSMRSVTSSRGKRRSLHLAQPRGVTSARSESAQTSGDERQAARVTPKVSRTAAQGLTLATVPPAVKSELIADGDSSGVGDISRSISGSEDQVGAESSGVDGSYSMPASSSLSVFEHSSQLLEPGPTPASDYARLLDDDTDDERAAPAATSQEPETPVEQQTSSSLSSHLLSVDQQAPSGSQSGQSYAGYSVILEDRSAAEEDEEESNAREVAAMPMSRARSHSSVRRPSLTVEAEESHDGSAQPVFEMMPDDDEGMWAEMHAHRSDHKQLSPASAELLRRQTAADALSAQSLGMRIERSLSPPREGASPANSRGSAVEDWIQKTASSPQLRDRSEIVGDGDLGTLQSDDEDEEEVLLPPEDDVRDVVALWSHKVQAGSVTALPEREREPEHERTSSTATPIVPAPAGPVANLTGPTQQSLLSPIALGDMPTFPGPQPMLGGLSVPPMTPPLASEALREETGTTQSETPTARGVKRSSPRMTQATLSSPSFLSAHPMSPGGMSGASSSTDLSDTLMDMERALELLSPNATSPRSPAFAIASAGPSFDAHGRRLSSRDSLAKARTLSTSVTPSPRWLAKQRGGADAGIPPSPIGGFDRTHATPRPASTSAAHELQMTRSAELRVPESSSRLVQQVAASAHDEQDEEEKVSRVVEERAQLRNYRFGGSQPGSAAASPAPKTATWSPRSPEADESTSTAETTIMRSSAPSPEPAAPVAPLVADEPARAASPVVETQTAAAVIAPPRWSQTDDGMSIVAETVSTDAESDYQPEEQERLLSPSRSVEQAHDPAAFDDKASESSSSDEEQLQEEAQLSAPPVTFEEHQDHQEPVIYDSPKEDLSLAAQRGDDTSRFSSEFVPVTHAEAAQDAEPTLDTERTATVTPTPASLPLPASPLSGSVTSRGSVSARSAFSDHFSEADHFSEGGHSPARSADLTIISAGGRLSVMDAFPLEKISRLSSVAPSEAAPPSPEPTHRTLSQPSPEQYSQTLPVHAFHSPANVGTDHAGWGATSVVSPRQDAFTQTLPFDETEDEDDDEGEFTDTLTRTESTDSELSLSAPQPRSPEAVPASIQSLLRGESFAASSDGVASLDVRTAAALEQSAFASSLRDVPEDAEEEHAREPSIAATATYEQLPDASLVETASGDTTAVEHEGRAKQDSDSDSESEDDWSQDGSALDALEPGLSARRSQISTYSVGGEPGLETPTFLYDTHLEDDASRPSSQRFNSRPSSLAASARRASQSSRRVPSAIVASGVPSDEPITDALGVGELEQHVQGTVTREVDSPSELDFAHRPFAFSGDDSDSSADEGSIDGRLDMMLTKIENIEHHDFSSGVSPASSPAPLHDERVGTKFSEMQASTQAAVRSALTQWGHARVGSAGSSKSAGAGFSNSPPADRPTIRRASAGAMGSLRSGSPRAFKRSPGATELALAPPGSPPISGRSGRMSTSPRGRFRALPPSPSLLPQYANAPSSPLGAALSSSTLSPAESVPPSLAALDDQTTNTSFTPSPQHTPTAHKVTTFTSNTLSDYA